MDLGEADVGWVHANVAAADDDEDAVVGGGDVDGGDAETVRPGDPAGAADAHASYAIEGAAEWGP